MQVNPENLLSVKVARVAPKNFDHTNFITDEEYNGFITQTTIDDTTLSEQYESEWRMVPNAFASVSLGEKFQFYIKCTNNSTQEEMKNVEIRFDLQIANTASCLKEIKLEELDAKQSIDLILSHEVKDPTAHHLICTLKFNLSGVQTQTRKYFQYPVLKPFDVKTKSYYKENDEIYMEILFQNLINLPLQMKSVRIDSTDFDVTSFNYLPGSENKWIFGETNRLNPSESRQYLFVLKPKPEYRYNGEKLKEIVMFGRVDIIWVSAIGVTGHIRTTPLEKPPQTYDPMKMFVDHIPSTVHAKKPFEIKLRLINYSSQIISPKFEFINDKSNNILWLGLTTQTFQDIGPAKSVELKTFLYPVSPGKHAIPHLRVTDTLTNANIECRELSLLEVV